MLGILARSFNTATRTEDRSARTEDRGTREGTAHWRPWERFDNRASAEIEAQLAGRRY